MCLKTRKFSQGCTLKKDKTATMVVENPLQIWNIDVSSKLKLVQSDINLSTKLRILGVIFDVNLTQKYEIASVKTEDFRSFLSIA